MVVSELIAKFGLRPDNRSFKKADGQMQTLVSKAKQFIGVFAGLAAGRAVARGIGEMVDAADQLGKKSSQLGLGVDQLQAWRFAASQSGVATNTFDMALQRFTRRTAEAAKGTGEAKDALESMGIQLRDSNGNIRNNTDLLLESADALANVETQSERVQLAFKLFDSEGAALVNLMQQGSDEVRNMLKQFADMGGGFSEEAVERSERLKDQFGLLDVVMTSAKSTMLTALMPVIFRVVTALMSFGQAIQEALKGTKFLEVGLATLATVAAIAAVKALAPWLPFMLMFAGITALVIGFIAIVEDLHQMLTGGKSLIGEYIDEWFGIGTVDNIVRTWRQGLDLLIDSVGNLWDDTMGWFSDLGDSDIIKWLGKFFRATEDVFGIWEKLTSLWDKASGFLGDAFGDFFSPDERKRVAGPGLDAELIDQNIQAGRATAGAVAGREVGESARANNTTTNSQQVTVDARGAGDPEAVKRSVKEGVAEANRQQAKQVRDAHVRRPG